MSQVDASAAILKTKYLTVEHKEVILWSKCSMLISNILYTRLNIMKYIKLFPASPNHLSISFYQCNGGTGGWGK